MARRFLGLIFLLAIGALAGAPFVVGTQMEQIHDSVMQKALAPGLVELKSSQFSRGWFSSTARDTYILTGGACAATTCKQLVVQSVIHHGPIAFTGLIDGTAPLRPVRGVVVSKVDLSTLAPEGGIEPALPPLVSTTVIDFDGSTNTSISMPPSQHTVKAKDGNAKLALGGVSGHISGTPGSNHVQGKLDLASLKIESANNKTLEMKGAGVDFDGETAGGAEFIGRMVERVDQVTATDAATGQPFDLQGFAVNVNTRADGNSFDIGLKTVSMLGRNYGPLKIQGEVKGLNRAVMAQIKSESQAAGPDASGAGMQAYQKHLPDLLKSNPQFDINTASLTTPDGEIMANLHIGGAAGVPGVDPANWLAQLRIDFGLQVPAVTLWNLIDAQKQQAAQKQAALSGMQPVIPTQEEIGAEVNHLVQANIFVPNLDANAYALQASLQSGRLTVNGQQSGDFTTVMNLLGGLAGAPAQMGQPGR